MIGFFYDLFYMLPLSIALILNVLGLGFGSGFFVSSADESNMTSVSGCIACCVIIVLILVLRHSGKKERFLISGILAAALISLFFIMEDDARSELFAKFSWLIPVLIISLAAIILGRMAENLVWTKITISLMLLASVVYLMVTGDGIPSGTAEMSFAVILIYLMEFVQRRWKKSGNNDVKSHVAHIAPILMVMCILISLLPKPPEAFDWKFAKNIWEAAVNQCKRIVSIFTSEDEYGYSGFSEDASVKAGVTDTGREVMLISYDQNSFDRLYLGGICYDNFNGRGWDTKSDEEVSQRELDFLETKASISKHCMGYERNYARIDTILVESRLYNTRHIFVPAKTNLLSRYSLFPEYEETESKLLSDSKMIYGDSYKINYMLINYANPNLLLITDIAESISKEEWNSNIEKNGLEISEENSYETYLKYKDNIYLKYGGKRSLSMEEALDNSKLSEEVKLIVRDVIDGAEGLSVNLIQGESEGDEIPLEPEVGDYEKLKALAEYFQTMEYNSAPGELPSDVNSTESYLNYFIGESKRGYCVHYATAFTLLARELGHPARYVQGYYVKKSNTGEVLVSENRAHAWAEVYFENFGWVTFEATPGYTSYKGWAVRGVVDNTKEIRMNPTESNTSAGSGETDELQIEAEEEGINLSYFVIPVLCAIFFGIIYILVSRIVSEKKYQKMDNEEKARVIINRDLRILKYLGYPLMEHDTLHEFGEKTLADEELNNLMSFVVFYEKLLYSFYEVTSGDVQILEKEYEILKTKLRAKGLRYRFILL